MSIYKEGDKVLVDAVDGSTGFIEVEITALEHNHFGDLRYRAGKRILHPKEIHGHATGHTAESVSALNSRHNRDREQPSVSSTGGAKNVKPEKFSLIPTQALAKVAEHYGVGAEKYAAHQWRQGYEWSKSYDALQRHATAFWSGEDNDPETKTPHMAAVVFHALTLLTFMDEHPNHDDRYKEKK